MKGKASGVPKMSDSAKINGSKPGTRGGKPAVGAGKNMASGRPASKVSKVK